ncbi:MAG TPA: amidohydrolase [Anaerolineaceae bacterium]|nr:amidohydrolase [Anaerolineaceae bacterium]
MDKTNIDFLLTNAHVLTMDKDLSQYPSGAVAVKDDAIVAVGDERALKEKFNPAETIDCQGKVLMPGLVNTHTHVPMTLLRGLADDLRLDVWLMGYMMPVEREFVSPEFVRLGTSLACAEMIRSGVTTFADMYYFEDHVARATADAGMRALCAQSVMKFPTPDSASFEEGLAYARNFIQEWKGHPLIVPSVAPHAVYTCTEEILRATSALAVEFDVPLHTHIAETALEQENSRKDLGMPVVPYMKKQTIFEAKVLAAHCVHVDEGEMRTMLHAGAGVAHNPSSNLKLASGIAPVRRMLEVGLNVGIGTDGPASNNDLDMFEEIRLAALISKVATNDPTTLPAPLVLLMATRMGANAMHIGDITGSLEPGKRADLIVIDTNAVHNAPRFERDPNGVYAQLVYAAKATDVTDVMINGKFVLRSKELLTLDEQELLKQGQEYARKIDTFLIKREKSVYAKLIAIGGAIEEESFEVQAKVKVADRQPVIDALLAKPEIIKVIRKRHYREYDTYFLFDNEEKEKLRYREDHFINDQGEITNVRSRLTHIGQAREHKYPNQVLLSRSRFFAPATQSLRFYREYFKPAAEYEIEKDRLRYLVEYKKTEFFINLDEILKPAGGKFAEIKSRTWSQKDAEVKSRLISELLLELGLSLDDVVSEDYFEMLT